MTEHDPMAAFANCDLASWWPSSDPAPEAPRYWQANATPVADLKAAMDRLVDVPFRPKPLWLTPLQYGAAATVMLPPAERPRDYWATSPHVPVKRQLRCNACGLTVARGACATRWGNPYCGPCWPGDTPKPLAHCGERRQ